MAKSKGEKPKKAASKQRSERVPFCERLEIAMREANFTNTKLSQATGIDKSSISHYMSGLYVPKQDRIYKLAVALDVNENWLLGFAVPRTKHIDYIDDGKDVVYHIKDADNSIAPADNPNLWALSDEEMQVIVGYRAADESAKQMVRAFLKAEKKK